MRFEIVRSSTQQGQAAEETVPEVLEARDSVRGQESSTRPRTGKYKARSAKTAAFSRKTMHHKEKRESALKRRPQSAERLSSATSKKAREDGIPHPAGRLISTIQKRGNCSPHAMQERSVKNKTRTRI